MDKYLLILIGLVGLIIFNKRIVPKVEDSFFKLITSSEASNLFTSEPFKDFLKSELFDRYIDTLNDKQIEILSNKLKIHSYE